MVIVAEIEATLSYNNEPLGGFMQFCKLSVRTFFILVAPFLLLGLSAGSGFARTEKMPGPIYVSPDGMIYVKHGQPIYLRLAVSPDKNAPSHLLNSDAGREEKTGPKPFYFEGHGEHTLLHPKDHKNIQKRRAEHNFRVFDDSVSPTTIITITDAPRAITGKRIIYGKPVTLTLTSKDADAGLFGTFYSLDGLAEQNYLSPLDFTIEKDYDLKLYAVDNVGNRSKLETHYYALDFTPPKTSHDIIGPHVGDILSPKSSIRLKSYDEKAGVKIIRYRFKGKKEVYKKILLNMKGLEDGPHELVYAAEDRVENAEKNFTYSFYLDTIPPETRYFIIGDRYRKDKTLFVSGRTMVDLTATDNKAGVRRIRYYVGKDRSGTIFTEPFGFPKKNGKTAFSYAASDNVINISQKTTHEVTVDITAPKVKPVFDGEHYFSRKTHYIRKTTQVSFSIKDNLSGVKGMSYKVDQELPVSENKPFSIGISGLHHVTYSAVDNVNNEAGEENMRLFVDEIPPQIFHHFSVEPNVPDEAIYPPKMLLYLASTDELAGIRKITYSINGGKKKNYVSAALAFNKTGKYSVTVESVDNVGNIAMRTINFQVRKF
jgi:hypothetical protein